MEEMDKGITAEAFFDIIKDKKDTITDEGLDRIYDNCLVLLNKYKTTGQTKAMKKLIFHLDTIEKEKVLVDKGINTFVYRDDIEDFIDNVSKDVVKIQDLTSYEREIPDEIVEVMAEVRNLFDVFYVVFTDYTGKEERKISKERQEKDPILFGTFQDPESRSVIDRFYYIGDWEDEYCDLTLDKMVNEVNKVKNTNIEFKINTPRDIKELREQLNKLDEVNDNFVMNNRKKPSFIRRVKTFLKGG